MLIADHAHQPLSREDRTAFADFLRSRRKVPDRQVPFLLHWVGRFCQFRMESGDTPSGEILGRFLDELSTEKEPWQVEQAGEAVRLFAYFLHQKVGGGSTTEREGQIAGASAGAQAGRNGGPDERSEGPPRSESFAPVPDGASWKALFAELTRILRLKHLSLRTERAYAGWIRRFRAFIGDRPRSSIQPQDVQTFISGLAVDRGVSESTQNQAFSALLFFFRYVLKQDLHDVGDAIRARGRRRLPVVLTRDEIRAVLSTLPKPYGLIARLIYGAGLRLQECLELRIKDIDFVLRVLTVRGGKGDKDRQTILPASVEAEWRAHLALVQAR